MGIIPLRRVLLGEIETGISKFEIAEVKPNDPDGFGPSYIWGYDEVPTLPYYPTEPYKVRSALANPGGLRVFSATFPPRSRVAERNDAPIYKEQMELVASEPSGMHWYDAKSPDGAGFQTFHSHDSIAIDAVVSGTIAVVASDGTREVLKQGDVVIFCGSNHKWEVISEEPCTVVVTQVYAPRRPGEEPSGTMEDVRKRIAALTKG